MYEGPRSSRFPAAASSRREADCFKVKTEKGFILIPFDDVAWIEAQGDYVKFHAGVCSCLVRMTMKTVSQTMDPARFLRVHRSTVINCDRIDKICRFEPGCYGVVLRDGSRLTIGGTYQAAVQEFHTTRSFSRGPASGTRAAEVGSLPRKAETPAAAAVLQGSTP